VVQLRLAPVAFDQDVAAIALFIVMGYPNGAGMRRMDPVAVNPDVAMTIPAVIAVLPNPAGMRWMIMDFDDGRRGRHTNNHLPHSDRRCQTQSKQCCQELFFHGCCALRGF
jgi:hypothetical protein